MSFETVIFLILSIYFIFLNFGRLSQKQNVGSLSILLMSIFIAMFIFNLTK